MKLTKRLLAVLLTAAMLVGMVGIAANATITEYDNYSFESNPYTAKIGLKIYKVDTTDDSATLITDGKVKPGDVIRVEIWMQTNYYCVGSQVLTAYDNTVLTGTLNAANDYATYDYRGTAAGTLAGKVITTSPVDDDYVAEGTMENPWLYRQCSSLGACFVGANVASTLKGNVPAAWKNTSGTTVNNYMLDDYMKYNCIKSVYGNDATYTLPGAGNAPILTTYQPVCYYNLTVNADAANGATAKIFVPDVSLRSAAIASGITTVGRNTSKIGEDGADVQFITGSQSTAIPYKDTYEGDSTVRDRIYDITEADVTLTVSTGSEPPVVTVNKDALKTAIDAGSGTFTAANSTTASWAAYTAALATANEVYASETADQTAVDNAKDALVDAQGKLALRAACVYTALDAAIAAYEDIDLSTKTPASVSASAVTAKYNAAKAVTRNMLADDAGANQKTIDDAKTALNTAIAALVAKANKADLKTAIDTLPTISQANATPASWSNYTAKLAAANDVYADDNATQAAVDTAKDELNAARAAVASLGTCNYAALDAAIAAYDELVINNYTPASVTASDVTAKYNDAKAIPRDILDTGDNQQTINNAASALNTAIAALVAKANKADLKTAIDTLPAVAQNEATSASWANYTASLAAANGVYADQNATQKAVDDAKADLVAKTAAVAKLPVCDYTALNLAIAAYDNTDWNTKTPASVTSSDVAAKYAAAKAITAGMLADEAGNNQTAITNAANALTAALGQLVARADKTALNAKIAAANALNQNDYTPASWTAADLATVVAAAQVVANDADATASAVAEQVTAIETAIGKLQAKADKAALLNAITAASALKSADYTPASWADADLATVIAAAQQVYDNGNATDTDVTEAIASINTATAKLKTLADKANLKAAIDTAPAHSQAEATSASWTAYTNALAAANSIYSNPSASQADVNAAETTLRSAIAGVEFLGYCDTSDLEDIIATYEGIDLSTKTPASVTASNVVAMYNAAKALNVQTINDEDGDNQAAIDEAYDNLNNAIVALVNKANKADLKTAIDTLPAVAQANATSASWADYAGKLEVANDVYADDNATQNAVDSAKNELNTARAAVAQLPLCDYSDLNDAIAAYEEIDLATKTPASVAASDVVAAYNAAKAVATNLLDDEDGDNQAAIDEAYDALNSAIAALVAKANTTALQSAINTAASKTEDNATAETWAAYTSALAAANNTLADANATQKAVDDAKDALNNANAALANRPLCDYTALDAAKALTPAEAESAYTSSSWKAYKNALDAANAIAAGLINNKAGTNQASINAAATALDAAFNALTISTTNIMDVVVDLGDYYQQGTRAYDFKVNGGASKIQVIDANGATMTFDRHSSKVSIASFNAQGQEIDYADEEPAYELWTVNLGLVAGNYNIKAKYGKVWDAQAYDFTVAYATYVPAVTFTAKPTASEDAADKTLDMATAGSATFTVVTPNDVIKVQLCFPNGATSTYSASKAVAGENNTFVWTLVRPVSKGDAGDVVLKVKTSSGWSEADCAPVVLTFAS